jgi:hypothetical protein
MEPDPLERAETLLPVHDLARGTWKKDSVADRSAARVKPLVAPRSSPNVVRRCRSKASFIPPRAASAGAGPETAAVTPVPERLVRSSMIRSEALVVPM